MSDSKPVEGLKSQVDATTQPVSPSSSSPKGVAAPFDQNMGSVTVGSLGELKAQSPDLYELILKGIAHRIVNRMKRHTENMKKIYKENR